MERKEAKGRGGEGSVEFHHLLVSNLTTGFHVLQGVQSVTGGGVRMGLSPLPIKFLSSFISKWSIPVHFYA